MQPSDLLVLALATWYVSYVVVKLPGPFAAFTYARMAFRDVATCMYCVGFWSALAGVLAYHAGAFVLVYPFAGIGAAMLLHRYTGGDHL